MANPKKNKPGQLVSSQVLDNATHDDELDLRMVELAGSPDAPGTPVREVYVVKVHANGGISVVNPDGTPISAGGSSAGGATEVEQEDQTNILLEMLSAMKAIAAARGIASDLRVTLLGGTTAVTGSLTGITTVTTLTNIQNIGGVGAVPMLQNIQNQAAVQSNINNVVVS